MGFFLLKTLKTTFKMRNLNQDGHSQGISGQSKLGHFFPISEKGQGRPPPSPPPVTRLGTHTFKVIFKSSSNLTEILFAVFENLLTLICSVIFRILKQEPLSKS